MILLDPNLKIKISVTLEGIMARWKMAQGNLHFDANDAPLPEHFTMVKLTRLFGANLKWTIVEDISLFSLLASKRIMQLKDLKTVHGRWRTPNSILPCTKNTRQGENLVLNQPMDYVSRLGRPQESALQQNLAWFQEIGTRHKSGWCLSNLQPSSMMHVIQDEFAKCN